MAKLSLPDAVVIRDELVPGANTAVRVGTMFQNIVNFVNLSQVPDDILTPTILTAHVDNYNPPGFATANILRMASSGANYRVTGFVAPPAGVNRIITITNIGIAGDRVDLRNNDAGSLPANRMLMRGNINIQDDRVIQLWYDHVDLRWRVLSEGT